MEHGLIPHPMSEAGVVDLEQNGLDGKAKLDVIPTTWADDQPPGAMEPWGGPAWNGKVGSGSALQRKKNDLRNTFDGTGRRLCTIYNIGEYTDGSRGNSYYLPGARGDLDDDWRTFAEELVRLGMGDTIIRPNAEHTHTWSRRYPTDANGNQLPPSEGGRQFADAFARCVSVMQSVSGADFTFIFSPAGQFHVADNVIEESYPTNSDQWPSGEPPPLVTVSHKDSTNRGGPSYEEWQMMSDAERRAAFDEHWHDFRKPFMDDYYNFAQSKGAGSGLVEWGVKAPMEKQATARGDNPYFIEYMIEYMRERNYAFETMWTTSHAQGTHSFMWMMDRGVYQNDLQESWEQWKEMVIADAGADPAPPPDDEPPDGEPPDDEPTPEPSGGIGRAALLYFALRELG